MRRFVVFLSLLLFSAAARSLDFGAPVPLTNAHYGAIEAEARLVSNGDEVFVFFARHGTIRAKVWNTNEKRVARSVMTTTARTIDDFDVQWVGTHFLLVATHGDEIRARLLDRNAFAYDGEQVVLEHARTPRIACNGTNVLLLHRSASALFATPLTTKGVPLASSTLLEENASSYAVASDGNGFASITASPSRVALTTFDAVGRRQTESVPVNANGTHATIASDGSRYFGAWMNQSGFATTLDAAGQLGAIHSFEEASGGAHRQPAAVWDGHEFVFAYVRATDDHALRLLHFDRDAQFTRAEPPRFFDFSAAGVSLVRTARAGTLLTWNPSAQAVVEPVPLQSSTLTPAPWGAAEQQLLGVATSQSSTLVVWNELSDSRRLVRSGVRSISGGWRETSVLFAREAKHGVVATDGLTFAVAVSDERASTAILLNTLGEPKSAAVTVPFRVTGIAAIDTKFALAGVDADGSVVRAMLDAAGVLSPVHVLRANAGAAGDVAAASNGHVLLVAWRGANGIEMMLDDASLPTLFGISSDPAIAWNGESFVVPYEDDGIHAALVFPTGSFGLTPIISAEDAHELRVAAHRDGSTAILWREGDAHRIAILNSVGAITHATTLVDDTPDGAPFDAAITWLPGGRVAYLASAPWVPPPHQGSPRVTMRVADPGRAQLPGPPAAPRIAISYSYNGSEWDAVLMWTERDPHVVGYRVEYRNSDVPFASWNEVERWFDGANNRATVYVVQPATQLRLRAITDFGISVPSAMLPRNVPSSKRRSAR
ncbi:MAG TPA: fibronectin type III domain-containing protein [Thermoanaerobaculia bacterium]|nr:fibronectin type III domain-containing protein [Thermoanaerobaculia bacterium]